MDSKEWKKFRDKWVIGLYKDGVGISIKEISFRLALDENLIRRILKDAGKLNPLIPKIKESKKSEKNPMNPGRFQPSRSLMVTHKQRKTLLSLIKKGEYKEASKLSFAIYFR